MGGTAVQKKIYPLKCLHSSITLFRIKLKQWNQALIPVEAPADIRTSCEHFSHALKSNPFHITHPTAFLVSIHPFPNIQISTSTHFPTYIQFCIPYLSSLKNQLNNKHTPEAKITIIVLLLKEATKISHQQISGLLLGEHLGLTSQHFLEHLNDN
jgi:hypothetical protein